MKKIVILSDRAAGSYRWISLLNALFPGCKIEICKVTPDREVFESDPVSSNSEDSMPS